MLNYLGRNVGLSFTDDEVCWLAWSKICECLNIDPNDKSYHEICDESMSKIISMPGIDINEVKHDKYDSIDTLENDLYRLIMKQDKVDDLDELIYDLIYKRNTLDELYEA